MSNVTNTSDASPLFNGTLNGTTPANSNHSWPPLAFLHANFEILTVQLRIVLSAISIIIFSANGALRRPPSAAPRAPPASGKRRRRRHEEMDSFAEGLKVSDAIMFPLLAGAMLVGLYYLIQWLRDPTILNRIMTGYISIVSIASLGKFFADALGLLAGIVFPAVWADWQGRVFRVDPVERCVWRAQFDAGSRGLSVLPGVKDEVFTLPLPRFKSAWLQKPGRIDTVWAIRRLVKEEWTLKIAAHGFGTGAFAMTLADAMGGVSALVVAVVYNLTGSGTLGNLVGAGLCYGALMIMSCTSFFIGTLVLAGLFVYDIVMVFYTPFMITVATKLDAPIKLTFHSGKASTLLGLGDIIVPGIFICLALRFDLWRHYYHKINYVARDLKKTETKASSGDDDDDEASPASVTTTEQKMQAVEVAFINPQNRWGDWLWTLTSHSKVLAVAAPGLTKSKFPKPYFTACIVGYMAGMLATLVVLFIFERGQPALLYLVPGVVGAVWVTGAARGELKEMWMYTEDGSLDTKDVVVEIDGEGKVVGVVRMEEGKKKVGVKKDGVKKDLVKKDGVKKDDQKKNGETTHHSEIVKDSEGKTAKGKKNVGGDQGHIVFVFSIRAPGKDEIDEDEV